MSNPLNQLSPRLSFSYSLLPNTLINSSIGRYFQLPAYTTLGFREAEGILSNKNNARYIGVDQYNLGFEHRFSKYTLLSVEGFYKDYFQYPVDLITGVSLANQGADFTGVAGASAVDFIGTGRA
ncbi:TonB-dependent receptor, partial [Arthrospira platensis SPKY1]|nr:TonB-dependent receptor [Arthrospira platensis SPKY1]